MEHDDNKLTICGFGVIAWCGLAILLDSWTRLDSVLKWHSEIFLHLLPIRKHMNNYVYTNQMS